MIGALINGMTIAYLGYLMEISADDCRPAYSAYFNALASPAALLPLVGAAIADSISLEAVFALAVAAAMNPARTATEAQERGRGVEGSRSSMTDGRRMKDERERLAQDARRRHVIPR